MARKSFRPLVFGVKIVVRVPETLQTQMQAQAHRDGINVSELVRRVLARELEQQHA
jgi:predicted HicB family RNase H-like nuclease